MNRTLLAFIFVLGIQAGDGFAQKQANFWYFGYKAGLDFTSGSPTVINNGQTMHWEGTACMSDAAGQLLFYTDGVTVWNKNHAVMTNGTGLMGHISTAQTLIVPNPAFPMIYYIFTADYQGNSNGLRYSTVNMALSGGLGAVITKNVFLASPVTEKITATRHQNHVDYWVVAHGWNNAQFYSYKITSSGVSAPVISTTGAPHTSTAIGWMHISPDGRKLALAIMDSIVQLFDFNRSTGVVSNPMTIEPSVSPYQYGVEFNMSGTILYVSTVTNRRVFQYDLTAGSQAAIQASEQIVGMTSAASAGALQMAPDGRIYMARYSSNEIAVIQNPDVLGSGCGFVDQAVSVTSATCWLGLPNYYNSIFYTPHVTSSAYCMGDSTQFVLNNRADVDSVHWTFDDPLSGSENTSKLWDPKHVFTDTGTYNVTAIIHCGPYNSTLTHPVVIKGPPEVNLGNDTVLCVGTSLTLNAVSPDATYLWQDGSTDSVLVASAGGTYWVTVTNTCGSTTDSLLLTTITPPIIDLGNDTTICAGDAVILDATYPSSSYFWSSGSSDSIITAVNAGTYFVAVSNQCGVSMDSIQITIESAPVFSLGPDANLCPNHSLLLNATYPGATYLWHDGSTQATFATINAGTFWVAVTNMCGTSSDTLVITTLLPPTVNLGSDTMICQGDLLPLNAFYPGATYLWNDGATSPARTVSLPNTYWVDVTNACGTVRDTLVLQNEAAPSVNLGADTALCTGGTLLLSAAYPGASYQWEDGSLLPDHSAFPGSSCWVVVSNACGSANDTIHVAQLFPPIVSLGNDTLICSGNQVSLNAQQPFCTYQWSTGSTASAITATSAGNYSVVITNSCGSATDSLTLLVMQSPSVDLGPDQTICDGSSTTLTAICPGASFTWHDGSTQPTFTTSLAGTYWVMAANMCGAVTDSATVSITPLPVTNLGPDLEICPTGTVLLDATAPNVQSYMWDDGTQASMRMVQLPGTYSVTVSNSCGSFSDTVIVTLRTPPVVDLGVDTVMCWGETLVLDLTHPGYAYQWSQGSSSPTLSITEPGLYAVTVTDDLGCTGADDLLVTYECSAEIRVPTAFTPNSDPPNDVFGVYGDAPVDFNVRIFNRWGDKVFESDDFNFGWDGTHGGVALPISAYVYIIRYRDFDGTEKQLQGTVTLLR